VVEGIRKHVFAAEKIHGDDTTVPVLEPGLGRTKTGRLWVYVRDDRPFCGEAPPAAAYFYSPDRGGEHPTAHMAAFTGFLQADGYAGFEALYNPARSTPGPITEVACWAHCRRKIFDVWEATKSPVAKEALDRIAAVYLIEEKARFAPAAERVEHRKETASLLDAFFDWAKATEVKLSAKSALAEAFRDTIKRREALTRSVTDGRLEADNNIAENAMRKIALGRRNYLFAGSDRGGERAAAIYTPVASALLNGLNPETYLKDILTKIASGHTINRIDELMPWRMAAAAESQPPQPDALHLPRNRIILSLTEASGSAIAAEKAVRCCPGAYELGLFRSAAQACLRAIHSALNVLDRLHLMPAAPSSMRGTGLQRLGAIFQLSVEPQKPLHHVETQLHIGHRRVRHLHETRVENSIVVDVFPRVRTDHFAVDRQRDEHGAVAIHRAGHAADKVLVGLDVKPIPFGPNGSRECDPAIALLCRSAHGKRDRVGNRPRRPHQMEIGVDTSARLAVTRKPQEAAVSAQPRPERLGRKPAVRDDWAQRTRRVIRRNRPSHRHLARHQQLARSQPGGYEDRLGAAMKSPEAIEQIPPHVVPSPGNEILLDVLGATGTISFVENHPLEDSDPVIDVPWIDVVHKLAANLGDR